MESNAVVSKLQSAIANFRREKDAAQRNRDLTLERLKTSATTLESEVVKTGNLQSRLDEIGRKIAAGNGQEIAQKKAENDRLGRETDFQHTELVRKKEKLAALQAKMAEESARRAANVRNVRRSVKMWREKNSVQQTTMAVTTMEDVALISGEGGGGGGGSDNEEAAAAAAAATAAAIEKLNTILSDSQERGGGEDADSHLALLLNLPRLIDSKAALVADDAIDMERKVGELRFVADRYRAETTLDVVGTHQAGGSIGRGGEQQQQQQPMLQPIAMEKQQQQQQLLQFQPMQEPVEAAFM